LWFGNRSDGDSRFGKVVHAGARIKDGGSSGDGEFGRDSRFSRDGVVGRGSGSSNGGRGRLYAPTLYRGTGGVASFWRQIDYMRGLSATAGKKRTNSDTWFRFSTGWFETAASLITQKKWKPIGR
jgi:hypothetical protein